MNEMYIKKKKTTKTKVRCYVQFHVAKKTKIKGEKEMKNYIITVQSTNLVNAARAI